MVSGLKYNMSKVNLNKVSLTHYTSDYNDFFTYETSSSNEFVLGEIKPAYGLFVEAIGLPSDTLDQYIGSADFKENYENAKVNVSNYIHDVYNKTGLANITKHTLLVITARNKNSTYVIKGELILRVINDFIQGKIELSGIDFKEFQRFVANNTPYWKDSLLEMRETVIQIGNGNLEEYLFLLDRYETYDKNFIKNCETALEMFIF